MADSIKDLRIAIVGAGMYTFSKSVKASFAKCQIIGMGGLASALALAKEGFKKIDVYEYAADLGFVGAGIQLAPNMARILDRLGVWEPIAKEATNIKDTSIRREFFCNF